MRKRDKDKDNEVEIQSKGVNAGALCPEETLDTLFLSLSCPIDHCRILQKKDQEAEIQKFKNSRLGRSIRSLVS